MYLISAYFDPETEKRIQKYTDAIASKTSCSYIKDNNIPPHITIAEYIPAKRKGTNENYGTNAANNTNAPRLDGSAASNGRVQNAETQETRLPEDINRLIQLIDKSVNDKITVSGSADIVSFGIFKPRVMFLTPVLNEYLHDLCAEMNRAVDEAAMHSISSYVSPINDKLFSSAAGTRCRPFSWLPHITIARGLNDSQMQRAFSCMQANFSVSKARINRIGLAVSKPYRDIKIWNL